MSTRKSILTSPTAHGTKLENASTSSSTLHNTKSLDKTNAGSTTADKAEMGAAASANTNIVNTSDTKVEQTQKLSQDPKTFQQRVTRNSPLLLASPVAGIIKKEPLDSNDHHTNSESDETGGPSTPAKKSNVRGRKSLKEHKEILEKEKETKLDDLLESSKVKEKEEKEEQIDIKEKESTTALPVHTNTTTVSNRLTRKSLVNQEPANTRVTRQRQSSGASTRSETPPARGRCGRGLGRGKMPVPMIDSSSSASKRKRSLDIDNINANKGGTIDEPGSKYIKMEVKDNDIENDEVLLSSQNTNASSESNEVPPIKIKQELLDESENEMPALTETNATTVASASVINVGRGKGRNPGRKSAANSSNSITSSNNNSPSTRATRQTKQTSPVQGATSAAEPKRRRIGSQTRSLLKTNIGGSSKSQPTNAEDEDSKDSMASTNTDDIVLALIKSEKISMEMDDDNTNDAKDIGVNYEKENVKTLAEQEESSDLPPPLIVDTDVAPTLSRECGESVENAATLTPVAASCSSVASDSEKAASLSPSELVSEGVSEISVKQFYKKPKFLENNLGIEEDPKLGNIVQKVVGLETVSTALTTSTSTMSATTPVTTIATVSNERLLEESYSNESIKEGALLLEESIDEKKSITQDDCNSLSSVGNETSVLILEDGKEALAETKCPAEKTSTVEEKSKCDFANDVEGKGSLKLKPIEVDEDDLEQDLDQEDELTLEESETISMDNNASINEEVATEVDEVANEIEDISDLTEVIENTSDLRRSNDQTVDDKSKQPTNQPCLELENSQTKMSEHFISDKKNQPSDNINNVDNQTPTAEDEDNDVLAKIDAELKKIDERTKEKINNNEDEKSEDLMAKGKADGSVKKSIAEALAIAMDIVDEIKLPREDSKTITKSEEIIEDDVIDIKLDDEQALIIAEDMKLSNEKIKSDVEEDVDFGTDMDNLLKEKSDIKKIILKSSSDTELEINGKLAEASSSRSSPNKTILSILKDEDSTSMKSGQSATSWMTLDLDNDDEETLKKKELHLQNLGLVTHKAAERRRLEVIQSSAANVEASKVVTQQHHNNKRNGKNSSHAASTHHEYTGTLKTIIKINRNSTGGNTSGGGNGRKSQNNTIGSTTSKDPQQPHHRRQSLKMTFQKGRARAHGSGNNDRSQQDRESHAEDNYYTIQNETEESHDHVTGVSTKKDEKEEILIPEKASSFKFHPGRLCEDQCFYCSGKFGLYDTPCHVGQIKSVERQQKILANEEKLTVDNCLCDACFRHVDRRANVPSYKKRLSAPGNLDSQASKSLDNQQYDDQQNAEIESNDNIAANANPRKCLVSDCVHPATHSIRRKCIRKSVKKFLIKFEIPTGIACVWLCQSHYDTVIQCSGCVLCKRRLGKNHMYHITSDTVRLEKALCEMGIPVQLGIGTAVCKLCRYFANLLMKPPDSTKSQKAEFVKNYRKRLLQFHNIHDGSNEASEADEDDSNSNSASNPDDQKAVSLEKVGDKGSKQVDTGSLITEVSLAEKANISDSSKAENTTTKTSERDFDTTGVSTDSSNSSSVSNTTSNAPNEMSKLKAILQSNASAEKPPSADISNVLRANPNISMRELFPGEEDLGLQFKVPFGGSGSQRTPEGWTRVQTFLQYDEPTRRLWEELQKPYGNQSSFLRHLILLEKYFRNGDLVLSASASNNASVYTQTVRQRLTSYDKGHCGGLYIGTGTPKENSNISCGKGKPSGSNTKAKEIDPQIPTFVINEDDDEENSEDQDVEITDVERLSKNLASAANQKDSNSSKLNKQQLQRSRSLSVDKLTKQLSSNAVTITARPKDSTLISHSKRATPSPQKSLLKDNLIAGSASSSTTTTTANLAAANAAAAVALAASTASAVAGSSSNSRSILKCNLLGINKSVELVPINSSSSNSSCNNTITTTTTTTTKNSINTNAPAAVPPPPISVSAVAETKQQKILDVANKLLGNHMEATSNQNKNQAALLSSPPELVSLQRRSTSQLASSTTVTGNTNNNQQVSNLLKRPQLLVKSGTSRPPPNVVILPDTLTPQERLQSKTWRPTLMPVEENHSLLNKNGPLYQTADGRRLPALVQVQSGGKPFLISIFDYNRMCILRREKLMRDQMLKATKKRLETKQQQQVQAQQQQVQVQQQQIQSQQQQQQHQQQQLQKTNIQNMNKNFSTSSTVVNQRQQQQQQNAEQQRMIQYQILEHQQAILKAASAALNTPNPSHGLRYQPILPKTATSNITTMPPLQPPINTNANFNAPMMPLLANAITNAANTGNVNPASTSVSTSASTHSNASWLWNNFPDANQLLLNGGPPSTGTNVPKLPQLLAKTNNPASTLTNISNAVKQQQQLQQQHQQQQFLLSKIPKSLTVIPQHKLMHNTATNSGSGNTSGNLMKE